MGLAGRPDEPDAFRAFRAEGVDIYVARDIWEQVVSEDASLRAHRLRALMPGYGMACFRLEHWNEESTL